MIAIPNVDKPKVCADCSVNDMVCGLWMEVANIKAHRHKDCPLIEIVRCKDCKHNPWDVDQTDYTCIWDDDFADRPQTPDDFCSYGERRTYEEH